MALAEPPLARVEPDSIIASGDVGFGKVLFAAPLSPMWFTRSGGPTLFGVRHADMGWAAAHLGSQLVLPLAQIDDVTQQTVRRPFDVADFDDHLRAHPMDPREHE